MDITEYELLQRDIQKSGNTLSRLVDVFQEELTSEEINQPGNLRRHFIDDLRNGWRDDHDNPRFNLSLLGKAVYVARALVLGNARRKQEWLLQHEYSSAAAVSIIGLVDFLATPNNLGVNVTMTEWTDGTLNHLFNFSLEGREPETVFQRAMEHGDFISDIEDREQVDNIPGYLDRAAQILVSPEGLCTDGIRYILGKSIVDFRHDGQKNGEPAVRMDKIGVVPPTPDWY